ncbi:MAG TPA: helix-turn-helix domain-containing protein [Vicinamibacterales bacterium]|nr:helix-turn-helix domain-containing protein [Vicinamibacterales bacterium]
MNQVATADRYLPLKALAAYSGLSTRTLRSYLTDRVRPLPHYRFGARIVVKQSEFDEWAGQFRRAPKGESLDALVNDVLGSMG